MKIKYNNTIKDIFLFNLYTFKLLPNNIIFIGIPFLIAVLILFEKIMNNFSILIIISFIVIYFIVFIFMSTFGIILVGIFIIINMSNKNSKMVICEHILSFNDDSLIEETDYNKNQYKWKGIYRFQNTKKYIRIFSSKVQAHIIPKNQLTEKETIKILDFLQSKKIRKM